MQIYVYNQNLELTKIITKYKSVIWAQRYQEVGDCEIYLPATDEYIQIFRVGYYLGRPDDNMTCRITKIEVKTDAEEGNYLTVTGTDVNHFCIRGSWTGLSHAVVRWFRPSSAPLCSRRSSTQQTRTGRCRSRTEIRFWRSDTTMA